MKRIAIGLLICITVLVIWYSGIADYFSLATIKEKSNYLAALVSRHYAWSCTLYILFYIATVFIGLPIVVPISMLGGYLFGLWRGILYSLIGATIGSTGYFLLIKRTRVIRHIRTSTERLTQFQHSLHTYGPFYLLFLHFITIVPYIAINTLAALSHVPLSTFIWTTAVAAVPGLFLYSFAGTQLHTITSTGDIIKPPFFLALLLLALLALLPIIINAWRSRRNS